MKVNTPGGGVVESAEILKQVKEIQANGVPVYVSMQGTAASGGYYISASADKIFALEDTLTGSLGVIMQSVNYSQLAENLGVEFITIKSGEFKDIMSGSREMTEEEKQIMQSMIDNSYNKFVDIIAEGRNMSKEQVRKIADGRIYDGIQAKQVNLVDEFGDLDDTIQAMKKDYDLSTASVVEYTDNIPIGSLFAATAKSLVTSEDVATNSLLEILSQSSSPRLMYLYTE